MLLLFIKIIDYLISLAEIVWRENMSMFLDIAIATTIDMQNKLRFFDLHVVLYVCQSSELKYQY